ncbi:biotin-dependent carboxyltransferase family protein [Nocardioides sp. zg-1308]|uniref:Biotin-dependent carboxyltransferase family protein n=1 Tax=Nocardioides renjunii TaxID=3095075 RepID=A0ABU5KBH1_9ACTN|nr:MULTISPECIES: biotin-dependent carboxyltransferase family protein [unclassified Nocardioides]MDZ5661925.1 biotin-dependent carboxyltransferase family protein [Nocardioides sp. S-58]NPD06368.1 biotin-dependent carboxyltransferase family protein [Nocardioides sp. zg-1308]
MSIEVLDPGPLATLQDRGRRGWAHLGVPRAGALDRGAAALALRLVGGAPDDAVVETTLGGIVLRTHRAVTLAVTGAPCRVGVGRRAVAHGAPVTVPAGAVVTVGPATEGVRSYVALAGGLDADPVLGSRSTDTLAWVGPPRLAAGQLLAVGRPGPLPEPPAAVVVRRRERVLRLHPGPRVDWLAGAAWAGLDGAEYAVAPDSDRVGLRLTGPRIARREGELPSEGIVLGAVQLPPSGEPVVFLADHPTTGGYPVVAIVDDDDLDLCAQLRPGERVVLRVV